MEVIELIAKALEPLNVINYFGWYDTNINETHITYQLFQELEGEFLDDENTTIENYIQLDLWSKDIEEVQRLKKEIKKQMKSNGFYLIEINLDIEQQTDIKHLATRWLYIQQQ